MDKLQALKELLSTFSGALIAYSGGVDSTFLAVIAHEVLGERFLAVTAVSPTYPEHQLTEAEELAKRLGLPHKVIHSNEFSEPQYVANPPERCYYCKTALFQELKHLAAERGLEVVLDGANLDDLGDYRPGHRAAEELGVRSPLQEEGFTKQEIRDYSKALALPTWDKPAYACLASRIPYGREITPEALARIDRGEQFLAGLGFTQLRLRDHYPVARIEVAPDEMSRAWEHRQAIAARLHEIGFPYVTIDLDGFRSGSMNETIGRKPSPG